MKGKSSNNNYYKQLLLVAVLVVFPIVMIIVNGTRAVEGILWQPKQDHIDFTDSIDTRHSTNVVSDSISFGIYEPVDSYSSSRKWDLRHIYISWIQYHPDTLQQMLQELLDSNTTPVLTVEPWKKDDKALMPSILDGDYDNELDKLKSCLTQLSDTILLSWGHEMDQDLTERYPWSDVGPDLFLQAYKYVYVYLSSGEGLKAKWTWAPVAKEGCEQYWPGEDYVDVIGIPLYSFPEWDQQTYGYIRSFQQALELKYKRVASFSKPIYILEFGVTGSADFKGYWLHQAFLDLSNFPLLKGLIFFNSKDTPGAWGANVSTPDWRLDTSIVYGLVDWYKTYRE